MHGISIDNRGERRLLRSGMEQEPPALIVRSLMFDFPISSDFLGDLENYTFLRTRWYKQSENQCFHLHRYLHGGHLGFFKMAARKCIFVNISASKCH